MPNILFYDTETTGKLNFKKPVADSCQPKIMQVGVILDDNKASVHQFAYIIKPYYEWKTEYEEAVKIHGITYEMAMKYGVPIEMFFQAFNNLLLHTDFCVCHNVSYDAPVIQHTLQTRIQHPIPEKSHICTMKTTTALCKIPGNYGFKWPKLIELYKFLFNEEFEGAHDALADVRATRRCYYELVKRGVLKI